MCDRCGYYASMGAHFCPVCGEPCDPSAFQPQPAPRSGNSDLMKIIIALGCIISALVLIGLIFELFVGIDKAGYVIENLQGYSDTLFLIVPFFVNLFTLTGDALVAFYVILLAAVTVSVLAICFVTFKRYGESNDISDTPLYEMAVLFAALFAVEFAMILILNALGIETDSPGERPVWEWMFDLLQASVWEEVITRFLYLGLPATVIYYIIKKEGRSPKWLLGGFGIDKVSIVFIFFSAFMFGAGHLNSWGLWKFIPTFLFGLIAGYLYCKYGIYATICMHFLTDYMQADSWLLGTGSSTLLTGLALFAIGLLGIPFIWVYLKRGALCLSGQLSSSRRRS